MDFRGNFVVALVAYVVLTAAGRFEIVSPHTPFGWWTILLVTVGVPAIGALLSGLEGYGPWHFLGFLLAYLIVALFDQAWFAPIRMTPEDWMAVVGLICIMLVAQHALWFVGWVVWRIRQPPTR